MEWNPDSGETVAVRSPVRFATGVAEPVLGLRSFRDPERNDIEGQLPGWPPGPAFAPRSPAEQRVARAARGTAKGLPVLINAVVQLAGSIVTPFRAPEGPGRPQEPHDEVDDFPVIWAASGAAARTLPWQLDPARRPAKLRTDVVVTDRRVLLLVTGADATAPAEVLWQVPRDAISGAERRPYSEGGADVKITFADGSWTRWSVGAGSSLEAVKLTQALRTTARTVTEADLTPGQRERVSRFITELPRAAEPPTFTVMPSGIILVEARVPGKAVRGLVESHSIFMGTNGEPAVPGPDDLT